LAELNNTITAQNIFQKLPLESTVSRWGDEIFFNIGVESLTEDGTLNVNVGDVAFLPEGNCLCVFFGRTPASVFDKPVSEKPVVIIGKTLASPDELRDIKPGTRISVARAEESEYAAKTPSNYSDSRKLSQTEIDILVKRLLEEKAKNKAQA
jgi:hypothetical protein